MMRRGSTTRSASTSCCSASFSSSDTDSSDSCSSCSSSSSSGSWSCCESHWSVDEGFGDCSVVVTGGAGEVIEMISPLATSRNATLNHNKHNKSNHASNSDHKKHHKKKKPRKEKERSNSSSYAGLHHKQEGKENANANAAASAQASNYSQPESMTSNNTSDNASNNTSSTPSSHNSTDNSNTSNTSASSMSMERERQLLILMLLAQVCSLHDPTPRTFTVHTVSLYERGILDGDSIRFLFDLGLLPPALVDRVIPPNGANDNAATATIPAGAVQGDAHEEDPQERRGDDDGRAIVPYRGTNANTTTKRPSSSHAHKTQPPTPPPSVKQPPQHTHNKQQRIEAQRQGQQHMRDLLEGTSTNSHMLQLHSTTPPEDNPLQKSTLTDAHDNDSTLEHPSSAMTQNNHNSTTLHRKTSAMSVSNQDEEEERKARELSALAIRAHLERHESSGSIITGLQSTAVPGDGTGSHGVAPSHGASVPSSSSASASASASASVFSGLDMPKHGSGRRSSSIDKKSGPRRVSSCIPSSLEPRGGSCSGSLSSGGSVSTNLPTRGSGSAPGVSALASLDNNAPTTATNHATVAKDSSKASSNLQPPLPSKPASAAPAQQDTALPQPTPTPRSKPSPANTTSPNTTSANTTTTTASAWAVERHPLSLSRYQREFDQVRLLASGAFGEVFHVVNKLDGREYAVKKVIFSATGFANDTLQMVMREVRCLAQCDHPNCVRYYTSWLEPSWMTGSTGLRVPSHNSDARLTYGSSTATTTNNTNPNPNPIPSTSTTTVGQVAARRLLLGMDHTTQLEQEEEEQYWLSSTQQQQQRGGAVVNPATKTKSTTKTTTTTTTMAMNYWKRQESHRRRSFSGRNNHHNHNHNHANHPATNHTVKHVNRRRVSLDYGRRPSSGAAKTTAASSRRPSTSNLATTNRRPSNSHLQMDREQPPWWLDERSDAYEQSSYFGRLDSYDSRDTDYSEWSEDGGGAGGVGGGMNGNVAAAASHVRSLLDQADLDDDDDDDDESFAGFQMESRRERDSQHGTTTVQANTTNTTDYACSNTHRRRSCGPVCHFHSATTTTTTSAALMERVTHHGEAPSVSSFHATHAPGAKAKAATATTFAEPTTKPSSYKYHICLYIQMQLCHPTTLGEWIRHRNANLTPPPSGSQEEDDWYRGRAVSALNIFRQVVRGLAHVHSKGIMHRDLKPANIFATEDGMFKIGDFGLSKLWMHPSGDGAAAAGEGPPPASPPSSQVTTMPLMLYHDTTNTVPWRYGNSASSPITIQEPHTIGVGTTSYAAPEQMTSDTYGPEADMFSLGLILLELFSNFGTEHERAQAFCDCRGVGGSSKNNLPVLPWELKQRYPQVAALVGACTMEDPKKRPTAAEVLAVVEEEAFLMGVGGGVGGRRRSGLLLLQPPPQPQPLLRLQLQQGEDQASTQDPHKHQQQEQEQGPPQEIKQEQEEDRHSEPYASQNHSQCTQQPTDNKHFQEISKKNQHANGEHKDDATEHAQVVQELRTELADKNKKLQQQELLLDEKDRIIEELRRQMESSGLGK